jgi:hypothetical protein
VSPKQIGKGYSHRSHGEEIWYESEAIGIIIPDYKRRYGIDEKYRLEKNQELFSDLQIQLQNIGLLEQNFHIDLEADCGMGLDFPVVALIITGTLALPTVIVNTINLIEIIRAYIQKKREESMEHDAPTIGMPIFDPKLLEHYCYEVLRKASPDLIEAGGDFNHVVTIDSSFKSSFYQYGVVYLMVFRSTLPTPEKLFPHWIVRVTCNGEILDIRQLLSGEHIPPHLYFDDVDAYNKATSYHK